MIELHRKLLGDRVRNRAFYNALKAVIVKGQTTIADIGSGTGFLSFLACALGAKECVLYDYADILDVSREIAKANRIGNCRFIKRHSTDVRRGPNVDVVISETLGNYALEENIVETLSDAKRFLKPGGIVIPVSIEQCIAPVTSPRILEEIDIWNGIGYGLDFSRAREISLNNMYVKRVRQSDLLDQADAVRKWDIVDFRKDNASIREATVQWRVGRGVRVYGFALWWDAELVRGIHLTTSPSSPRTHWDQIFLPVVEPIVLKRGERLTVDLKSDSRMQVKINLSWRVRAFDVRGTLRASMSLDMRKGHLD